MSDLDEPETKRRRKPQIDNLGSGRKLYVILENCSLDYTKIGHRDVLLSSEDGDFISKHLKADPSTYRPDILHQCLLNVLDSPLNRAGLLNVFIHTTSNVLISVSPQCRIPRTFKRFCGLMIQLLAKRIIKSAEGVMLMKIIKNPVTSHLPVGCEIIMTSYAAETVSRALKIVPTTGDFQQVAIVVGCIAKGQVKVDYPTTPLKISNYPLSAAITCTKICSDFEEVWGIF